MNPSQNSAPCHALLVNGSVGAGKTTVAYAIGDVLAELTGPPGPVPHTAIDVDAFAQLWPAPADDPFNTRLRVANLNAVWTNLRAAGARYAVVATVIEKPEERAAYAAALTGCHVQQVRLVAPVGTMRERIRARGRDHEDSLRWHLDRAAELDAILNAAAVDDFAVVNDRPLPEVAAEVLRRAGWPCPQPAAD